MDDAIDVRDPITMDFSDSSERAEAERFWGFYINRIIKFKKNAKLVYQSRG